MKEVGFILGLVGLIAGTILGIKGLFFLHAEWKKRATTTPPPVVPPAVPAAAHGGAAQAKSAKAKSWVTVTASALFVLSLTGFVVAKIRDSEMDRPRREEILQAQFALLDAERKALVFPSKFSVIAPTSGWSESIIRPDDTTAFVFSVPQGMGRWIECWEDGRTNNFSNSPGDSHAKVTKFRSRSAAPITIDVVRHTKP